MIMVVYRSTSIPEATNAKAISSATTISAAFMLFVLIDQPSIEDVFNQGVTVGKLVLSVIPYQPPVGYVGKLGTFEFTERDYGIVGVFSGGMC
jgi:hypothetical protein